MTLKSILLGTVACTLLAAPVFAQDSSAVEPKHHHGDSVAARLDHLERVIEEQQAEIRALKGERASGGAGSGGATTAAPAAQPEVTAQQFEALQNQVYEEAAARKAQPTITFTKVHVPTPGAHGGYSYSSLVTLASPDNKWTLSPIVDVMGDWAAYDPGQAGVATNKALKQSGENFRRAQIGFQGKLAGDFSYKFLVDFGGANGDETYQAYFKSTTGGGFTSTGAGTGPHIKEAWVGYKGILDPFTFKVGAMPTPTNLADTTNSDDLLFNERPSPAQLERGLAADDGRDSVGFIGNGDWWNASAFLTGDTYGKADLVPPGSGQEAIVARAAVAPFYDPATNFNVHLGGNVQDVIHPQEATSCTLGGSCSTVPGISLSDRPELRVDNVTFLKTPTIAATGAQVYGLEGAASWGPLLVQAENFWYDIERVPTKGESNPNFSGWYVEGSWVITGEFHQYNMATASYTRPNPDSPVGEGGFGAWEVAGRYSSTDLEYHTGLADAVYGGKQNILSTGINWYPINAVKVMFDYDIVSLQDIGGLTGPRTDDNGHFTDLSTRVQVSF